MNTAPANRTVIRSNAQGTVNRAQLRKLIEAGRIEARTSYRYDEMSCSEQDTAWMPAHVREQHAEWAPGKYNIDASDFRDYGRAYISDRGQLLLRVHQNYIIELRVVS